MRRKQGILLDGDRVPARASQEALQWLLAQGLKWNQIEAISGIEGRTLRKVTSPGRTMVTHGTHVVLEQTVQRVMSDPFLLVRDAAHHSAEWTVWQVRSLMAIGWTEDILAKRARIRMPRPSDQVVTRKTRDTIEGLFLELHHQWGPSRYSALTMWRKGILPPDCYDWEEGDLRPIPGSFRPDLVTEACTYAEKHAGRVKTTRRMLQSLGQWARPECARTAHRTWCEAVGYPVEDYVDEPLEYAHKWRETSPWCHNSRHNHDLLPEAWR